MTATQSILAGAALAGMLALAGWALFTGLRARAQARGDGAERDRLAAAEAAAPVVTVLVRGDGRIDASPRLAEWLGLLVQPRFLAELGGDGTGLAEGDLATLGEQVAACQKSARGFGLSVTAQGGARTFAIRGARAPAAMKTAGGVLLWLFDQTEAAAEAVAARADAAQLDEAFGALSGLLEAAPMPMWYRGPDLRLAMVNAAYVGAVGGGRPRKPHTNA